MVMQSQGGAEPTQPKDNQPLSEAFFRSLSTCCPVGILATDRIGRCQYLNPKGCSMLGISLEESIDRDWTQLLYPDDRASVATEWLLRADTEQEFSCTCRLQASAGNIQWVQVQSAPLWEHGKSTGYIHTITPIAPDIPITQCDQIEENARQLATQIQAQATVLSAVLSASVDHIYIFDREGRYQYVSHGGARVIGHEPAELVGKTWRDLNLPAGLMQQVDQQREAAMVSGQPVKAETEYIAADGAHYYEYILTPWRSPDQAIEGVAVISRDISDRKRTEQAQQYLAEATQTLSSSLDYPTTLSSIAQLAVPQLADWCTVHLVQEDGAVLPLVTAHTDPDKVAWAQAISQQYPFDPKAPHGIAQVLRTGQSEFYPDVPDQLLVDTARDAEHLQLLRQVGFRSAMLVPLVAGGRSLGVIAFVAAESGRCYTPTDLALAEELARRAALAVENAQLYHQAQQARQRAEQAADRTARLQAVTAAFSEALTLAQVAEVVVNQGIEALGASAGYVALLVEQGESLQIVESVGYPDNMIEQWQRFSVTVAVPAAETVRTGQPIFLASLDALSQRYPWLASMPSMTGNCAFASIPMAAEGRLIGGMNFSFANARAFSEADRTFMITLAQQCAQAITRARLYEAEQQARAVSEAARAAAEAANQIKDEFLAVLSHELRTPLNPILGWSKLLRTGTLDPHKTAFALETIERNAKLQTQLIEDLLDISRILQGKLALNIGPVDLAATIAAAQETMRLAAEAKAIDVRLTISNFVSNKLPNPQPSIHNSNPPVLGDANRLQQVVWNLLSNAVKFTPTGGRIEVTLEYGNAHAQIQVTDNGKGISSEFLPYVFDTFRQADGTTTRKFGGLGLGLAIVRRLVELHGGTVEATSAGEGQGASFTVRLPLFRAAEERGRPQPAPLTLQASPLIGLRILVVDDDLDMREFITVVLEQSGADVTTVASATEALHVFTQLQPDILLSDIGMPEMDGYTLLRQIRALPSAQGGQIPAIALSAYAGDVNHQSALLAGFHQHIAKPVEPADLVATIVALVQQPM